MTVRASVHIDIDEARATAERLAEKRGYAVSEEFATPDPLETARRMLDAVSRRDFDALMPPYSADAVLDRSAVGLAVIEGREAIRSFFEEWTGAYDEYEVELEEFRDLGNGVFFQALLQRGRPRGTGGSVQLRFAFVVTTEDGLVVDRQASYTDIDEGRAAAERLAEERG